MKILIASSEIVPFASTGGLGDVCAALPKVLAKLGMEIIRIMPLYRVIDRNKYKIKPLLGVIPLNKDPDLLKYPYNSEENYHYM